VIATPHPIKAFYSSMLNREDFVSILFFDDIESMEASYTEPSIYKFYYFPDLNDQWPAPGSEDTELGVFMGPEVRHGEAEVYTRVQA
jgi:hypothetical protein